MLPLSNLDSIIIQEVGVNQLIITKQDNVNVEVSQLVYFLFYFFNQLIITNIVKNSYFKKILPNCP